MCFDCHEVAFSFIHLCMKIIDTLSPDRRNEQVLLPLNEPTFGTAKKSQIQTFLEQNGGPGLQHIVSFVFLPTKRKR